MRHVTILCLLFFTFGVSASEQDEIAERAKTLMDRAEAMARDNHPPERGTYQTLPSKESMREALDKATKASRGEKGNVGDIVNRAYIQTQAPSSTQRNTAASTAANTAFNKAGDVVDPAEIAKLYQRAGMQKGMSGPKDELLVFVSTSIPAETLKVIGAQANRYGAILVLRGVAGGFSGKNLRATVNALKPATDQGADVQIHPELFKRYGVNAVPTTVLAAYAGKGCEEGFCAQHIALVGDVSIEYALEEFSRRKDKLGRIAEDRLAKARNTR